MKKDMRSLHRIDNSYGKDLTAQISVEGEQHRCKVLDYNSLGVAIEMDYDVHFSNLDLIEIYYGSERICYFENPKLIRRASRKIILSLNEKSIHLNQPRQTRVTISETQQGVLMGPDPIRIHQTLYFRVNNVSETGCRLISSKSNRHLTPGLHLANYNLMLPGLGYHQVSMAISNSSADGSCAFFGVKWIKPSEEFRHDLKKYILMNLSHEERASYAEDGIRSLKVKNFSSALRLTRISTPAEFQDVLHLRYAAYQSAQKLKDGTTWQDMTDQYDQRSIIYTAHFGQQLVGTMRLCFADENTKFPFEEYLQLKDVLPLDRTKSAEVSRLAVDPELQGSDLFIALFRHIIIEIGAKQIQFPVCLATDELAVSYRSIGAKKLSPSFPHPVMKNENLALYLFDPETIIDGKMNSLGWFKVAKPSLKHLHRFQFIRKPSRGYLKFLRLPFDVLQFLLRRKMHKRRRQKIRQKKDRVYSKVS